MVEVLYTRCQRGDTPAQRAEKRKASSEAQKRMNQTYSWQKLELMLSTNFPTAGSGLVVTLTCDDKHEPKTRAQMSRRLQHWRKKMNEARKESGLPDLVAFWCIEVLTSSSGRWHAHVVINNTGNDAEMIRSCWIYGSQVEIEKLRVDSKKNWETLAKYMTKEARECQDEVSRVGARTWSYTRNAKKPEVDTMTVDDSYELTAPEGATVLLDEKKWTEFASYHILKYRLTAACPAMTPRAKRRKPRR